MASGVDRKGVTSKMDSVSIFHHLPKACIDSAQLRLYFKLSSLPVYFQRHGGTSRRGSI